MPSPLQQRLTLSQERAYFLQAQLNVAQVALSSLQSGVLEPALLEAIGQAQGYSHGFLWRLLDNDRQVQLTACDGTRARQFLGYSQAVNTPHSAIYQAIQTRQPLYVNHLQCCLICRKPSMITVLLADDHGIVRQGLRLILEAEPDIQVIGEAQDGLEALALAAEQQPDVLVLDLLMPGFNGLEVARRFTQRQSGVRVVILSMHANEAYVLEALRHGAIC